MTIVGCTIVVIASHGLGLVSILILSGSWVAWRRQLSPAGLARGVAGRTGRPA